MIVRMYIISLTIPFLFSLVYYSLVSFGLGWFFGLQNVLVAISRRLALPFSGGFLETLLAGGIVIWWVLIRNSRYESILKLFQELIYVKFVLISLPIISEAWI